MHASRSECSLAASQRPIPSVVAGVSGTKKPSMPLTSRAFLGSLLCDRFGYFASEITSPEVATFPFAPTAHRVVTVPIW